MEYVSDTYGMFSAEGDRTVAKMVKTAKGKRGTAREKYVCARMRRIAREHDEVFDTAVRDEIITALGGADFDLPGF